MYKCNKARSRSDRKFNNASVSTINIDQHLFLLKDRDLRSAKLEILRK